MNIDVRATDRAKVEARLGNAEGEIRKRAWELYCRRGGSKGNAIGDWRRAELERSEAPLAGITEDRNEICITACVPRGHRSAIVLDVLPDEIIVEDERNGEVRRFTRFPLPARIDPTGVRARLRGHELDIVAQKEPAKRRSQAPAK